MRNAIIYDINKTKTILFFRARKQKLLKQITTTKLRFSGQVVEFNQKTALWLEI